MLSTISAIRYVSDYASPDRNVEHLYNLVSQTMIEQIKQNISSFEDGGIPKRVK